MSKRNKTSEAENCGHLKDEVYRQMFRLEASRPGADLSLALALLRAWLVLDSRPRMCELQDWLRKICPICLSMIDSSQGSDEPHRTPPHF